MTTPNEHRFIHECRDCDYPDGVEYVGNHCAGCPLCRFRIDLERAWAEVHNSESYRVIEKRTFYEFQDDLNEMTAAGWSAAHIRIGHSEDRDDGGPVYIAVFRRDEYDRERHQQAVAAEKKADTAHREKAREIQAEVQALCATRNGEATP